MPMLVGGPLLAAYCGDGRQITAATSLAPPPHGVHAKSGRRKRAGVHQESGDPLSLASDVVPLAGANMRHGGMKPWDSGGFRNGAGWSR